MLNLRQERVRPGKLGICLAAIYPYQSEASKMLLVERIGWLDAVDGYMLILESGIALVYIYSMLHKPKTAAVMAARSLVRGPLSVLFWTVFVGLGLLAPLLIVTFLKFVGFHYLFIVLAWILVIIGGVAMRYLIVMAGQLPTLEEEVMERMRYGLV